MGPLREIVVVSQRRGNESFRSPWGFRSTSYSQRLDISFVWGSCVVIRNGSMLLSYCAMLCRAVVCYGMLWRP